MAQSSKHWKQFSARDASQHGFDQTKAVSSPTDGSRLSSINPVGHSIALDTEIKANYAERVIRSLRAMMFRYFTYKQTYEYVNILQDLVYNYNHRPHRSLGGKFPNDVNASNEPTLRKHMYVDTLTPKPQRMRKHSQSKKPYKKYKFKIGDCIRLTHIKHLFQRDHQAKWTEELFIIKQRFYIAGIPTCKVTDYAKDDIEGRFY